MAFGIVEILAVGGGDNAHIVWPLFALDKRRWLGFGDLNSRTTVHVVHPNLIRRDSESSLGNKNVFPIWRPRRRNKIAAGIFRNLLRVGSIRLHDPNVVASLAVGEKRNPFPIGREPWLAVKGHAAGNQLCLAAFDGQRIDVAKHFEYDRFAIWRDIQREPSPFVRRELNLAVALEWKRGLLLVLFLLVVFLFFFFF